MDNLSSFSDSDVEISDLGFKDQAKEEQENIKAKKKKEDKQNLSKIKFRFK